MIGVVGWKGE
uniref:Uncharacterized protein n=1 Tax=Anguilla anguilla TaxID=7936 RepID=A0A0E9PV10_ANGAN